MDTQPEIEQDNLEKKGITEKTKSLFKNNPVVFSVIIILLLIGATLAISVGIIRSKVAKKYAREKEIQQRIANAPPSTLSIPDGFRPQDTNIGTLTKSVYTVEFGIGENTEIVKKVTLTNKKDDELVGELKILASQKTLDVDTHLLYMGDDAIYVLNKITRELVRHDISGYLQPPYITEVKADNITADWLGLEGTYLSNRFSIIRVENTQASGGYGTFLLNKESGSLHYIDGLSCTIIYCGDPIVVAELPNEQYILRFGAGDGCWTMGKLFHLDAFTVQSKLLTDFGQGCSDEEYNFVGFLENKVVLAKRSGYSDIEDFAVSLHSMDWSNGNITTLIDTTTMPKNILQYTTGNNGVYLYTKDTYYIYDLGDGSLTSARPRDDNANDILNNKYKYDRVGPLKTDTFFEKYGDYFKFGESFSEVTRARLQKVFDENAGRDNIYIVDQDNDYLDLPYIRSLLRKPFVSQLTEQTGVVYPESVRAFNYASCDVISDKELECALITDDDASYTGIYNPETGDFKYTN